MSTKPKLAERPSNVPVSHETDFFAWAKSQATALEQRRTEQLDWDHLADEIKSLANSEKSEIESRLAVLLQHLLKWDYQPSGRKTGWRATVVEQRRRIARRLRESPSLKSHPAEVLEEEYGTAVLYAADETGLPVSAFPARCPYTVEQVLDPDFLPGAEG